MIEVKNLYKSFPTPRGSKAVFSDFSLTVKDGTFLGISGESGAGKSTLLSIITGLQRPSSGKVFIDGKDIFSLSDKEISSFRNANIGFVSQEQSFLENLTVLDNVALPALLSKKSKLTRDQIIERAKKLLADFEIADLEQLYPSLLSGGENQRLLIARALMNDPKIIVADEPTDAVSERQTKEITRIFKALSNQGKTVILVSHDKTALENCDDIFLLKK
ncbi:ABC transporter ATP-binding protein [Treponema ruminis]|uniref:ABC-type lipoprotein export system ATPase subunit n=1 Tax=Treponema ruminis TaxID=744515 RepID=A0A7W8G8U4_9SPIR|nr:ABC transporter ATP-binding protein [Treponema ruminis]MBB5225999.1 ABC-type lipoprotein export system ATPase subunit [Treponema ruminis]QSI03091.1 ABC transporter ATP-binding protein [Treponema ruminis]